MAKDVGLQTIRVNLPRVLVRRVQGLGFNHELSASSIVEHALLVFMGNNEEAELADRLRGLGATLRRL
jgi:hypothetical protein